MVPDNEIRALSESDAEEAGHVLAESMMIEPGYVVVLPGDELRRRVLVPLLTDTVRESISCHAAFGTYRDGHLAGVSLWSPPGAYPPQRPDTLPAPHLPPYLRNLDEGVLRDLMMYDESCVKHFPDEPAWYLMYLGVLPGQQGGGIGSALLQESLRLVLEREEAPIYLETGTERNVRFYERFGFEVREAGVQLVPGETRHWTMLRPARTPGMEGR